MKPYVVSLVPEEDFILLEKIRAVVMEMPDIDLGRDKVVSCHMVSRALAQFFPVEYQDGYFRKGFEHSWLVTKQGSIIDPYPCYIVGGPILVHQELAPSALNVWRGFYKKSKLSIVGEEEFLLDSQKVTEAVGQTIKKLGMEE